MSIFRDINLDGVLKSKFGELYTAQRSSQFNFKPTWGISELRYTTSTLGAGTNLSEVDGEFLLESGTDINSLAQIQTNQRGQYQAGAMGQMGIGVRIPVLPTGTQSIEWGYTDFENGFYFGIDATGKYIALVTKGVVTKVYQADWNLDKVDGTGNSGLTLNFSEGYVSQIDFVWYGYGDIDYCVYLYNPATLDIERIVVHSFKKVNTASIVDPNQPLTFRVQNGAASTSSTLLYVGGHQFSTIEGRSTPQRRNTVEVLSNYTTQATTDWQPLIAIRKKALFNGRTNSVNVKAVSYGLVTDGTMDIRITVGGVTSNLTFSSLTGWTTTETAAESKVTGGTVLTASSEGNPIAYDFISAAKNTVVSADAQGTLPLGQDQEIILWIRRVSATGAQIINQATITLEEEW